MILLQLVEAALIRKELSPATFGREATGDPNLVFDLRAGREPREATRQKIMKFINGKQVAAQ